MTAARTDFGICRLLFLVSSWPNLRTLYIAGDIDSVGEPKDVPPPPGPATCKIEDATFERFIAKYEEIKPMFAGSVGSLKELEMWTMGYGEIDTLLPPHLCSLTSLRLGGAGGCPSAEFIRTKLATDAPQLDHIHFENCDSKGEVLGAFASALSTEGTFPALRCLGLILLLYARARAQDGTYTTGRGRNYREHEYANKGEKELLKVVRRRGMWTLSASRARELKYEREGAQRRAIFAAVSNRYGGW